MSKAQIITIAEIKGGTGKTTTAAALAQAAALDNKRVLVIDLDAQANITNLLGANTERGAVELLAGFPAAELIQKTEMQIDVIAGGLDLGAEQKAEAGGIYRLQTALEPIIKNYDLIIIDTAPTFSILTSNALQASNGLLIALEANTSALQGFYLISDLAKRTKQTNAKLKVLGCIITKYNPRAVIYQQIKGVIEEQAKAARCPLLGEIRQGVAIQEAQAYGKNLFTYAPKSKPAQDYKALYKSIIK